MMKDKKKIERFLRNAPGAPVPEGLLERLHANITLKGADKGEPPCTDILVKVMGGRIPKLAAAAVIVIAVGFLVIHTRPRPQTRTDGASQAAKTPGEMLTVLSLNITYRKGGMDAVEKQYEKAFKMLGPRLTSISVQDLLAECNSNWKGQYYEKD